MEVREGEKPKGRSGTSICAVGSRVFMFGGTNVQKKFSDFWVFENGKWEEVEKKEF